VRGARALWSYPPSLSRPTTSVVNHMLPFFGPNRTMFYRAGVYKRGASIPAVQPAMADTGLSISRRPSALT
jgi:hypothetical protein